MNPDETLTNEDLTAVVVTMRTAINRLRERLNVAERTVRSFQRRSSSLTVVAIETPADLPTTSRIGIEYWIKSDGSRRWYLNNTWHVIV